MSARKKTARAPSVYSAQTVADFCEVDLKTVHHWADRGKVAHFRTEGRHLRFRRNDVVRFLRAHEYPLPDALARARPTVAMGWDEPALEGNGLSVDELAKRLGSRFSVRRHSCAAIAVAHLLVEMPDALLLSQRDATLGFPHAIAALKADPKLSWIVLGVVAEADALAAAREAGAEIVVARADVARFPGELARALAVI
ncbi:MAG: hypothetical protein JWP97_4021 [Labilithrix sp.]|nr:hypothetical protein [Labilithrix sp.]